MTVQRTPEWQVTTTFFSQDLAVLQFEDAIHGHAACPDESIRSGLLSLRSHVQENDVFALLDGLHDLFGVMKKGLGSLLLKRAKNCS
jgi:hypothetical protein